MTERICLGLPEVRQRRICPLFGLLFSARQAVFELPGGWGVEPPLPHLTDPLPLVKIRPQGGRVSTPHLSFFEVCMLLDSHFLLLQFLKYLQHDELNVTTIIIHIED